MSVRRLPSFGPVELTGGRGGTAAGTAEPGLPGGVARRVFRKTELPSSLVVVIGAGGIGGAISGQGGGSGGNTIFHTLVAPGGAGGVAGSAAVGGGSVPGGNGEPGHVVVWEWA